MGSVFFCTKLNLCERASRPNPCPFGTFGMPPAESASRAGGMPKASRDRSLGSLGPKENEIPMNAKLKKALGLDRPRLTLSIIFCGIGIHLAFPRYVVATGSMIPTIPPGSYVIALRLPLLPVSIEKNDVAVFRPVKGISPAPWIHRIVADSGEQITPPNREGRVDISAEGIGEKRDKSTEPLLVPESFVYQSGDSATSYHGLIPKSMVVGKVFFHLKLPWR